jgi:hypothetical protein
VPHDGEGGFEARGQCLVHVSLYIGQKVILNVDIVLGRYAAACGVKHTLMLGAWSGANYGHAAGGGTRVRPAELLEEPIMFGHEVGEEKVCRCKCCDGDYEWFPGACRSYAAEHPGVGRIKNWPHNKTESSDKIGEYPGEAKAG